MSDDENIVPHRWYTNWKSTMAYLTFVCAYIYTIFKGADAAVINVSGYIALWSSLFMMFRSQVTTRMLGKIINKFPGKA